ncbi:MAG: YbaB/EbfC family DNA-binding protein [Planctomycetota bacterium]|nr:MAG: YbaB/EbfC family DNA-binding protein [Planctomycetota bacterium]
MFDQLKMMGAVAGLLKNRDEIKAAGERIQQRLESMRVEGSSEGGLCRAVVSGKMEVVSIDVSPTMGSGLAQGDEPSRTLACQMIADAVNEAIRKAQVAVAEAIDEEGERLGLPGLGEQLGQFLPR